MVIIYITNKKGDIYETYIDLEDLDKVKKLDVFWHIDRMKDGKPYYIRGLKYIGFENGKSKYKGYHLHKVVMNCNNKEVVDHIDRDRLNNRKYNLRITNSSNNLKNRPGANLNSKTGYRNVCYVTSSGKYRVQLQVNGKSINFGEFINLEDAVACAKECREKYYKEFKGVG